MKSFNLVNNIAGWGVFALSLAVYLLTLEPTVSWWDCGEFITSAYKLEVGHPPGAPFFIILGRVFALLAPTPAQVALMVNSLSAVASAATVMLLYWTLVHLARRVLPGGISEQTGNWLAVGSGLVGALAFAFTDSFWFSAVEGEVYALSSLFTAAVFWAILKWENCAGEPGADRWLVLIAYLLGLSIGVHLLNLLAIPAIVLVYYFRRYPVSFKGVAVAMLVAVAILGAIQYIVIPQLAALAFLFDKFFVNSFGLPFNSGVLVLVLLLIVLAVAGIRYTLRHRLPAWNLAVTMLTVILIGYSSYALIVIRASANPPMNQNHPDNAFALNKYLNRSQYGSIPLFYGPYYSAPALQTTGIAPEYNRVNGRYEITGSLPKKTEYDPRFETIFPRMYSSSPAHVQVYRSWGEVKGRKITVSENGQRRQIEKPTFTENLRFFLKYQVGHMYVRYFMWNFSGRQNDVQGHGDFASGNWITGISFLDNLRIGPQDKLPPSMAGGASRNTYFMIPFLLGLIGMFYQFKAGKAGRQGFWVVMLLFFFTGLAIIVYLNQAPVQPRERDYAYAGSFYAFAIWIGLAVPALFSAIRKYLPGTRGAIVVSAALLLAAPVLLAAENWNDHNRSGRYMTRDYARNYLESCAPNAILFTYGDNDTFPLWYVQEVEGVRPDVRIVNLSLLGMDWYIRQLKFVQNESAPVALPFADKDYYTGKLDVLILREDARGAVELNDALNFLASEDPSSKLKLTNGEMMDFLPVKNFFLNIDKQQVLQSGTVKMQDSSLVVSRIEFSINKNYLLKSELMVLAIIAANNWERPVYFDNSLLFSESIFLNDYLQYEGLAYRLVPIKTVSQDAFSGRIDTDILYENVMNRFTWGKVNDPGIFLDDYNKKSIKILQARYLFSRLAEALNAEGKTGQAEAVLDRLFEIFPDERVPLSYDSFPAAEQYYRAGAAEKGNRVVRQLAARTFENLEYYFELPDSFARVVKEEQERELAFLQNLVVLTQRNGQKELNAELDQQMQQMIAHLQGKIKP